MFLLNRIAGVAIVLLTGLTAGAQALSEENFEKLTVMEDSMIVTADSMFNAFLPETHVVYSERLARQLVKTLRIPSSYQYPFSKLKDKLNIIVPPDSTFRMFNWEVDYSNIYRRYYGAIQLPGEKLRLFGLLDYSEKLGKYAEDSILTRGKWYGALYYRIIPVDYQGRVMYNMLGFSNASPLSDKKVLDPMFLTDSGAVFGWPVFGIASQNNPRERVKRFILEHKKDVQVTLKWDAERQAIVFDNLVSAINDPARKYTYIPSGQYDGLRWSNGMWNYVMNLVPVQILHDGEAPTDER